MNPAQPIVRRIRQAILKPQALQLPVETASAMISTMWRAGDRAVGLALYMDYNPYLEDDRDTLHPTVARYLNGVAW